MPSNANTVESYLKGLPPERREAIATLRGLIVEHLPTGYEEVVAPIGPGMLVYQVPLRVYPDTYNGQPMMYAALASQKSHMALYLMCAYASPKLQAEIAAGFRDAGKRLDMGKSCIRFRKLDDLPLAVIAHAVGRVGMREYVERLREIYAKTKTGQARAKAAARKSAPKSGPRQAAAKPARKAARQAAKKK